jgi:hypothetical protein
MLQKLIATVMYATKVELWEEVLSIESVQRLMVMSSAGLGIDCAGEDQQQL